MAMNSSLLGESSLPAGVSADMFLNKHWEEVYFNRGCLHKFGQSPIDLHAKAQWHFRQASDFPEDSTGRFDEFENFVKSNFELCKWIGSLIVAAQVLSILLAMILRALGPDRGSYYDSDDDLAPPRLPLLRDHSQQHPTYVVDPHFPSKNDSRNVSIWNQCSKIPTCRICYNRAAQRTLLISEIYATDRANALSRASFAH
ncbi:hypothetical protein ACLOJK_024558 [Asimina triloba]